MLISGKTSRRSTSAAHTILKAVARTNRPHGARLASRPRRTTKRRKDRTRGSKTSKSSTLYEEYIHLEAVRKILAKPKTANPYLEPSFNAAMHSVEIGMVLMGTFLRDQRSYVTKRQRIDAVGRCIEQQCTLLAELIDSTTQTNPHEHSSLSQLFPFSNCPPTVTHAVCLSVLSHCGCESSAWFSLSF